MMKRYSIVNNILLFKISFYINFVSPLRAIRHYSLILYFAIGYCLIVATWYSVGIYLAYH